MISFILLGASIGGAFWAFRPKLDKKIQLNYSQLVPILNFLSNEWTSPSWNEREVEQNCPILFQKMAHVGMELLRCNPEYLKCRVSKMPFDIQVEFGDKSGIGFNPVWRLYSNSQEIPHSGILITLKKENFAKEIVLEDECHKVYLPQRRYRYIHSDQKELWYWDNFNRHIYIDRFMVNNQKIQTFNVVRGKKFEDPKELAYMPATNVKLDDMKAYCFARGGHLLQAHVYDAATVYPKDTNEPRPETITLSPYPWSSNYKTEPLFKWQEGKSASKPKEICQRLRSSDCQQHQKYIGANNFETWMGLGDIMNGYSEVFDNPIEPNRNVQLFDVGLESKSRFFSLFNKIEWDNQDLEERNFEVENIEDKNIWPLKLGFRCMYYEFGFSR